MPVERLFESCNILNWSNMFYRDLATPISIRHWRWHLFLLVAGFNDQVTILLIIMRLLINNLWCNNKYNSFLFLSLTATDLRCNKMILTKEYVITNFVIRYSQSGNTITFSTLWSHWISQKYFKICPLPILEGRADFALARACVLKVKFMRRKMNSA